MKLSEMVNDNLAAQVTRQAAKDINTDNNDIEQSKSTSPDALKASKLVST